VIFNLTYDPHLIANMFQSKNNSALNVNSNEYDLELDSNFGLHDYNIYFCIRNQVKKTFVAFNRTVYKVKFDKQEMIRLDVVDSDMEHEIGIQLIDLPSISWSSGVFKSNLIKLIGICDLVVFDSNNRSMIIER
jgi:CO dehydrogenase nickel-insertion accessory protein CooC1